MITLPETIDWPIVAFAAFAALALIALLARLLSRPGSGARAGAELAAAVKAERDTLRAQHAVEVARLEHKLAAASETLNENLAAVVDAKDAAARVATVSADAERLSAEVATLKAQNEKLLRERDDARLSGADAGDLRTERDAATRAAAQHSATIERLRAELDEAQRAAAGARADTHDEIDSTVRATLEMERDRLAAEVEHQSTTIAKLRADLQAALTERPGDDTDAADRVRAERDAALAAAERETGRADVLRREVQTLAARLAEADASRASATDVDAQHAAMADSEARLKRRLREQEATVNELRAALAKATSAGGAQADDGAAARLRAELDASAKRERTANESLSALAYERDGLRARVGDAERVANTARVEIERKEALLELRLQKIYDLENRLRDQHTELRTAVRRAESAEAELADAPNGEAKVEASTTVAEVKAELDALRAENKALKQEREGETPGEERTGEMRAALERLAQENAALRARPAVTMEEADVAALKEELRTLAARFLEQAEAAPADDAARSLAERIRAFKAARAAGQLGGPALVSDSRKR